MRVWSYLVVLVLLCVTFPHLHATHHRKIQRIQKSLAAINEEIRSIQQEVRERESSEFIADEEGQGLTNLNEQQAKLLKYNQAHGGHLCDLRIKYGVEPVNKQQWEAVRTGNGNAKPLFPNEFYNGTVFDTLQQLGVTPVAFYYHSGLAASFGLHANTLYYGLIAQDVERILPNLVRTIELSTKQAQQLDGIVGPDRTILAINTHKLLKLVQLDQSS